MYIKYTLYCLYQFLLIRLWLMIYYIYKYTCTKIHVFKDLYTNPLKWVYQHRSWVYFAIPDKLNLIIIHLFLDYLSASGDFMMLYLSTYQTRGELICSRVLSLGAFSSSMNIITNSYTILLSLCIIQVTVYTSMYYNITLFAISCVYNHSVYYVIGYCITCLLWAGDYE